MREAWLGKGCEISAGSEVHGCPEERKATVCVGNMVEGNWEGLVFGNNCKGYGFWVVGSVAARGEGGLIREENQQLEVGYLV